MAYFGVRSGHWEILIAKKSLTLICLNEMLSDCRKNNNSASNENEAQKNHKGKNIERELVRYEVVRRNLRV
jgi:hypothetical protein